VSPAPSLIRSGWWVAAAAAVVVAAMLALALGTGRQSADQQLGDGRSVASYGFNLEFATVPRDRFVAAGMPRDGLVALDNPATFSVAEVESANQRGRGKFLVPRDRVLGVQIGGAARAYPLRLLRWHEVVNDTIGGTPLLVTYNPLCDSAVASGRSMAGEILTFGISGLVLNSNMLLYDRRPDPGESSLWSQLDARAVAGPAAADAAELTLLPATIATWEQWRKLHPDTDVLAPVPRLASLYRRDPYHSYFGSDLLRFPVDPLPPPGDLELKDRVLIVSTGGRDIVFALRRMAQEIGEDRGVWQATVAGRPLRVEFDVEAGTAVVGPATRTGSGLVTRQAFWFAWYAAHPETPPPGPGAAG
jgi:hypothetical protein